MPQFYNGKVYGYTCIKKVAPSQKQSKVVYFVAEEFSIVPVGNLKKLVFKVDGKKYAVMQRIDSIKKEQPEFTSVKIVDGVCMVASSVITK
jgi:predicted RNA-binding protein associated with RNAse of E/G family